MGELPLALHLDENTRRGLEKEARLRDVPESAVAEEAIRAFLNRQAWMRRDIEEAVREADKGVFISEEAMLAWMDRLEDDPDAPPPEPDIFPNRA